MGIFKKKQIKPAEPQAELQTEQIHSDEFSHIKDDYTLFRFMDKILHQKAEIDITTTRKRKPGKEKDVTEEEHEYRVAVKIGNNWKDGSEFKKSDEDPAVIAKWAVSIRDFIKEQALD